jgi:uncharacterized membrane protein YkvA (DUF1232 family)
MSRLLRLWKLSGRDIRLLFDLLRRPDRPRWLVPALLALAVFGLEPFNFALPALGVVDDLILLPLIIRALAALALRSSVRTVGARDSRVVSEQ